MNDNTKSPDLERAGGVNLRRVITILVGAAVAILTLGYRRYTRRAGGIPGQFTGKYNGIRDHDQHADCNAIDILHADRITED